MKLPKSITVLGQEFSLELIPQKEIEKMLGPGTFGATNYSDRRILIASDANEVDTKLVLFHELFHCLTFCSGLSQITSPEVQEMIAEGFANGIIEILNQLYKAGSKKKQSKNGSRKRQRGAARRNQGRNRRAY